MSRGIIFLLLANFFAGAVNPTFVKLGGREIPPLIFTALRFILATILLLPFYIKQKEWFSLKDQQAKWILFNSLFFALNVAIYSIAIQHTTVLVSNLTYTLTPIIVGVLGFFILGERLSRNRIIGTIIAFSGLLFLILQSASRLNVASFGTPTGNILMFLSISLWSAYLVLSKKIHEHYSNLTINFVSFAVSATILTLLIPFELAYKPLDINAVTSVGIVSLFGAAIFSSVIFYYFMQKALKITGAFITSLFTYTGPLFGILAAIPIFGEKLTLNLIFGGFLIVVGVFYATSYSQIKGLLKFK
ncbi:DMT family transporter [Candidatus Daviesbacteria bacterium]|nr:DMT family transporter [Candidatus Daviesbacteria bacterium]